MLPYSSPACCQMAAYIVNTSRAMALLSALCRASAATATQFSSLVRRSPKMTFSSAPPTSPTLSMVMPECAAPAFSSENSSYALQGGAHLRALYWIRYRTHAYSGGIGISKTARHRCTLAYVRHNVRDLPLAVELQPHL